MSEILYPTKFVIEPELIGKRYFGGIYSGAKGNAELWEKVSEYIANTYDSNTLKTVYINGDGAD